MNYKGSTNAFSSFQVDSQDVWDADDKEYFRMISQKTAQTVLESHKKESFLSSNASRSHLINANATTSLRDGDSVNQCQSTSAKQSSSTTPSVSTFCKQAPGMGVRLKACPDDRPAVHQRILDRGRFQRFYTAINAPVADLTHLRQLSWSGVPGEMRPLVWKLLCDYVPASQERRVPGLTEKRKQYASFVKQYFHLRNQPSCREMFSQIQKDLNRMRLLYRKPELLAMFERLLFIWSMQHPGSGYVQGINDLPTPFFVVFLSEYTRVDLNTSGELSLSGDVISATDSSAVEADVFWCMSHLLDAIQDNYTFAQPGIQHSISLLASLIERIDARLHRHLADNEVEYLQFAFRWMNNLLIRELPLRCVIRLWDTYMAERSGFSAFHVYVCAAFLLHFSADLLRQKDFQGIMVLLQHLPTYHWTDDDISMVLAEAYKLHSLFASAPHHLDYQQTRPSDVY